MPERRAERTEPRGWGSVEELDEPETPPTVPPQEGETPAAARHRERLAREQQRVGTRPNILGKEGKEVHLDPIASGSEEEAQRRWQNNQPLPLPSQDPEVQKRIGAAWEIVSRLWPEMAGQLETARLTTPEEDRAVERLGTQATAGINPRTGDLAIPRAIAEVPPEILWHELVHLEQLRNGVLVQSPMYDEQGIIVLIGKPKLEQAIRHYIRSRNEDDICEA